MLRFPELKRPIDVKDEFYYKVVLLFFGVLYFFYRLMPAADLMLQGLCVLSILPILSILFGSVRWGGQKTLYLFILASGFLTVLFADYTVVTIIILFYVTVEAILLPYCSPGKSEGQLERELRILLVMFVGLAFIIACLSMVTLVLGIRVDYSEPGYTNATLHLGIDSATSALVGVFANANAAANLMVMALGSLLYLKKNIRNPLVFWIPFVLFLAFLILTKSRGGLVGAMGLFAVYIFFWLRDKVNRSSTRKILLVCLAAGLIAVLFLLRSRFSIGDLLGRDSAGASKSTGVRVSLWTAAFRILGEDPITLLFGTGGNFRDKVSLYISHSVPEGLYGNMHNSYMQTLLTLGVIGFILFMILILKYVFGSLRMMIRDYSLFRDLVPLLGMAAGLLVVNLVESGLYMSKDFQGSFFWITIGYVYSIMRLREGKASAGRLKKKT